MSDQKWDYPLIIDVKVVCLSVNSLNLSKRDYVRSSTKIKYNIYAYVFFWNIQRPNKKFYIFIGLHIKSSALYSTKKTSAYNWSQKIEILGSLILDLGHNKSCGCGYQSLYRDLILGFCFLELSYFREFVAAQKKSKRKIVDTRISSWNLIDLSITVGFTSDL